MPPGPPAGIPDSFFSSGISHTIASVVRSSEAIDEAFWSAVRTTLVGSMTPALTRSSYFSVAALKPKPPEPSITLETAIEPSVVLNKIVEGKGNFGFNAQTEEYGDLVEMGVVDPTKVARTALQNASSVAGLLLTTDVSVAEAVEDKPKGGGGHGHGGMGDMGMGGMDM